MVTRGHAPTPCLAEHRVDPVSEVAEVVERAGGEIWFHHRRAPLTRVVRAALLAGPRISSQ